MKLSAFKFELPSGLLAMYPRETRDESRLMVIDRSTGKIEHKVFKDLLGYLHEGDNMILNDTKVFPAQLNGNKEKTGAEIEVFLLRELNKERHLWDVLVDPARKIRVGNKLYFGEGDLVAEVIDNTTSRGRTIRFLFDGTDEEFSKQIYKLGETPLPKEIDRNTEPKDRERFQTVYATKTGAVSAPAAGIHFTPQMLKRLELKGVDINTITLHLSLGTFRSVEVEDLSKHKMISENYFVPDDTTDTVNLAMKNKKNICAIGTTVFRAIETSVSALGHLKANDGWTDKFIFPPFEPKIVKSLVTNFHLPKSTLLMNVAAFGGYDLIMEAYQIAIKDKYRFFSYGDAMLII